VDEVIAKALVRAPEAITWVEPEEVLPPAVGTERAFVRTEAGRGPHGPLFATVSSAKPWISAAKRVDAAEIRRLFSLAA
jgi:hypothetical protein